MPRQLVPALIFFLAACSAGRPEAPAACFEALPTPLIIAHRGASGVFPEHTAPAFAKAIEEGADMIEPDLVMTKDGVLIVRHDRYLSTSTDVASRPEFAGRKRVSDTPDGPFEDWWAEDFTLAEIKTLRAVQPFPGHSSIHDGQFEVLSFAEVLELAAESARAGHVVGVYPETKAPGHHAEIGLPMTEPLLDALEAAEVEALCMPVLIQSFEADILTELRGRTSHHLVQLLTGEPARIEAGVEPRLERVRADGIAISKAMLLGEDGRPTGIASRAQARGLFVHAWTLRDDDVPARFPSPEEEVEAVLESGVDGVFTDFPATAVTVRRDMTAAAP